MLLSDSQRRRCFSILDAIQKHTISKMFAQPVDPIRDHVPNYYELVKNPMDLGTVRKKLEKNEYKTVSDWKEDMELIWKNSLIVNSKTSILGYITLDIQSKYQSLTQYFTDSQDMDWMNKLYFIRDELNGMSRRTATQSVKKETVKPPKSQKNSNLSKQSKQKKQQPLTRAEILRLTQDINRLTDEIHILSIFDIFKKFEPQIETNGEKLEVDIAPLKPSTLWALRETVDQLLGLA